jgi:hypothetical protein
MTNMTMDCVGAPPELLLLCMICVVCIFKRLAHTTFNGQTPIYAGFGITPDSSASAPRIGHLEREKRVFRFIRH